MNRGRALQWAVVAGTSLVALVSLGTAGRLPAVDLFQHALLLREVLDPATDHIYEFRWAGTNSAFYGLMALLHVAGLGLVEASRWAACFTIALLPIAAAAVAHATRRPPILGVFAWLGAFGLATAWGFLPFLLGMSFLGFAVAMAHVYARQPTRARGAALAGALLCCYPSHALAWMMSLPLALAIVLLHAPCSGWRARVRAAWPVAVTAILTLVAWGSFVASELPTALATQRTQEGAQGPGAFARLGDLPGAATAFAAKEVLAVPWLVLLGLILVISLGALGVALVAWDRRRHRVARAAVARRTRAHAWARRSLGPGVLAALIVLYLVTPMVTGGVFMVYPRFLVAAAVLLPLAIPRVRLRDQVGLGLAGAAVALWMILGSAAAVRRFDRHTVCIRHLGKVMRPGESIANLIWKKRPAGYRANVYHYLAAELATRHGGVLSFDLADYGHGAVALRPGITRTPLWPVGKTGKAYDHEQQGLEFTALFLVNAPDQVMAQAARLERGAWTIRRCGIFSLMWDPRVAPGSRPGVKHLHHAVGGASR